MNKEEIAEVIEEAADYLETYGWYDGGWFVPPMYDEATGEYKETESAMLGYYGQPACLLGALKLTILKNHPELDVPCRTNWDVRAEIKRLVADQITEVADYECPVIAIPEWNDDGASRDQVLDVLRGAAKQALLEEK